MSKENFKKFVKANPKIIDYVKEHNTKWQELYEIYDIYGENEEIWNKYINSKSSSVDELVDMIKKVNMESIQKIVDSLQKTINIIQEINGTNKILEPYEKSKKYVDIDD